MSTIQTKNIQHKKFTLKYSCKFPGCSSGYYVCSTEKVNNKHFYRFPRQPEELLQKWKTACELSVDQDCSSFLVCEDHFCEKDFMNKTRHRLNRGVVPKCFTTVHCVATNTRSVACESAVSDTPNINCAVASVHNITANTTSETNANPIELPSTSCGTQSSALSVTHTGSVPYQNKCTDGEYAFLCETSFNEDSGVLGTGVSKADLTPRKSKMYKIHRNTLARISKLKAKLDHEKSELKTLKDLYERNIFSFIENNLNSVAKEFINSQLRNAQRPASARRWTTEDKVFALSLYKRSPRLYKYLSVHFSLPSVRHLKSLLSAVPFEPGLNSAVMNVIKSEVEALSNCDKYCALLFDEMSLERGLYYDASRQQISGFQDLGHLGRSNVHANHALVFMVRGIRKSWKQVVAYYYTHNTVSSATLKVLITYVIGQLQETGLKVVCTVCDQGATNQRALKQLCRENSSEDSSFQFLVRGEPVAVVFDVPHLLKNTRNALLGNKIQFGFKKEASFEFIHRAFLLDQQKMFKTLPKLQRNHFDFKDSFIKMKVKVAAAQLSHSVAAVIETYVAFNVLPAEAIYTAEFVEKIDCLFDSLNSSHSYPQDGKSYKCALSAESPHIEMWYSLLKEMNDWKVLELGTGRDKTNMFSFISGWKTTMRSLIFIWNRVNKIGFSFLSMRAFNQDPLENIFCCVRQHGVANTNPTCFQFKAALKTVIINNMSLPVKSSGNCEDDICMPLSNLRQFLRAHNDSSLDSTIDHCIVNENASYSVLADMASGGSDGAVEEADVRDDRQALAYVAGYILKNIGATPETNCGDCKTSLFAPTPTEDHVFTSFREFDTVNTRLLYASDNLMSFLANVHSQLYAFLDKFGHQEKLEDNFCSLFIFPEGITFCKSHFSEQYILRKCVPFMIYKYVRDCNQTNCNKRITVVKEKLDKKFKGV